MNKIKLSLLVIISFTVYSLYSRITGISSPQFIATKQLNPTQGSSNANPTVVPTSIQASPTGTTTTSSTVVADNNPVSTSTVTSTPLPTQNSKYKNGTYIGSPADAFYGNIQVAVTITNGNISKIKFLQAPNGRSTSIAINSQADPILAQEAISSQSANVNIVSGATDTSQAFIQSLQSALNQA